MKVLGSDALIPAEPGLQNLERLGRQAQGTEDPGRIREVAREFESLLVGELMKAMRRTIPEAGVMGGGMGEEVFTEMLDEELARVGSQGGGLGLGDMLVEQLDPGPAPARGLAPEIHRTLLDGAWVRPLAHVPTRLSEGQRFGAERPGLRPDACGDGHCGVDLAKPEGTPVVAVREGWVVAVHRDPGSSGGLGVTVRHPGNLVSRMFHLSAIGPGIEPGAVVRAGQKLGRVGDTGTSSHGSHLHFELIHKAPGGRTTPIDPEPYLRRWTPWESSQVSPGAADVTEAR